MSRTVVPTPLTPPMLRLMVRVAASNYGLPAEVLTDRRVRRGGVPAVRQNVMWAARKAGFSLSQIGDALGGLDHTTVLHGIRRVDADLADGRSRPHPVVW